MCLPAVPLAVLMAVTVATTVASAATSIIGQTSQRNAEKSYQSRLVAANQKQMQENRDLATTAYLDQVMAVNNNLAESRESVAVQNFDTARRGEEARAATLAAASEAGVNGVSLNGLLADFHRQEGMFASRNETNLLFKQQQASLQRKSLYQEAVGQTKRVQPYVPGPIAPVDYMGPILAAGSKLASIGMSAHQGAQTGATKGTS